MEYKITGKTIIKKMDFNGDIIITDPCYVLDGNNYYPSYGITNSTLYGDWSCHVWKAQNDDECIPDNVIGEFCADSGLVMVADYDKIKEKNPSVDEWVKDHDWCATIIRGFKGTVEMVKIDKEWIWDEDWKPDSPYGYKKGDKGSDSSLELYGKGNINWIAAQTGL